MLRIIPKSVLWLLEPMTDRYRTSELIGNQTSLVIHHLQHVALGEGIDPKRILFAKRTSKANHIFRHRAADLFLDCFIYGAHSTATDALRGVGIY